MSPAYIFTTNKQVNIMALKTKETKEEITFDDLIEDIEYGYEEETNYTTISGKEYQEVYDWTKFGMRDLDIGEEIEGIPEITYFENKDKKYDSLRVRILDDGEYADLYINIPKPDKQGYITNIKKGFDFYRTAYDFIFSILRWRGESNVVNNDGEEVNKFSKVNIMNFAKFVDQMNRVGARITEGNKESDYNSWIIYKME